MILSVNCPSPAVSMSVARFLLILVVLARLVDRWVLANLHLECPGPMARLLRSGHFLVPGDLPRNEQAGRGEGSNGAGGGGHIHILITYNSNHIS